MAESRPDPSLEARFAPLDDTENVVVSQASQQTETYVPDRAAASSAGPGGRIGDYEILAEIARGGMGVVYKARHVRLGSLAAVKLIRSGEFAGEQEIQRFHTEARAAAQLSHPGIVSVHQVGEHAGQHFLAMAYVDGQSLWQRVKELPLEPKFAAKLMQQVADAIQYAHDRGIIHRDLKPQNILLETSGPQPSTLNPKSPTSAWQRTRRAIPASPQAAMCSAHRATCRRNRRRGNSPKSVRSPTFIR
jgi:serine/threonine protein kinase